ncbi:putative quinol monooxygenase [Pararhizobium antarcticum]|uniref:Antibiotic biosynthesis monooxygenase n=1 Tax=Pararhizobium antarcticum TaxID=1798805 RepID=A0A657LUQ7_9HYPH|nr:putative quinol monooxygenase [Pararhizobium antarcticum]OJF97817.1 antibiotic biosynthesis monooxygenase [Rhizobium sp. 58]OJF98249.1 antibiotic biosynthesis monooxygenase [Pararhizobium antarcticum]
MVYVVAYVKVQQGRAADVVAVAQPLIAAARLEKDCLSYDLYQKPGVADTLVFVENWRSRASFDAHLTHRPAKAFQRATASLVIDGRVELFHPEKVEVL